MFSIPVRCGASFPTRGKLISHTLQCSAGSFQEFAHAFHRRRQRAKLAKLIEIEGYDSIEEFAQAVLSDSVSPAICMNEDCNFTCEMEPDQDAGYCEECRTNSMQSALILAGLI